MWGRFEGILQTPQYLDRNIKQLQIELAETEKMWQNLRGGEATEAWSLQIVCFMVIVSTATHLWTTYTTDEAVHIVNRLLTAMCADQSQRLLMHILQYKNALCVSGYNAKSISSFKLPTETSNFVIELMKGCANQCDDSKLSRLLCFITVPQIMYTFGNYYKHKVKAQEIHYFLKNVAAACMSALLAFPDKWKTWGVKNIKKAEMKDIAEMFLPVMQEVLDFVHEKEPWSIMTLDAFLGHGKPDYAKSADHLRRLLTVQPQVPHKMMQCMLTLHMEKKRRTPEDTASADASKKRMLA
jgi:hypothetical protein